MVVKSAGTTNNIPLHQSPFLHLRAGTAKGRGIFASRKIPSGTVIDTSPVLVLDPKENAAYIEKTVLYHYTYNWPLPDRLSQKMLKTQAVVLGLGSMFNHSTRRQNIGWTRDLENEVIIYRALRDIDQGEELCISYGSRLTFVDADSESEGADGEGEESESDVLSRIQLDA